MSTPLSASEFESRLLPIVRQMETEKDKWLKAVQQAGQGDIDALARLANLRATLYRKPPETAVDSLVLLGCIRSIASYAFLLLDHAADNPPDEQDIPAAFRQVNSSVVELLTAIDALRIAMERDVGVTLNDIGAFQDEDRSVQ